MRFATLRVPLVTAALLIFGVSTADAEDEIRTERVHFKPGTSGATVKGKIRGYETVDYVLEAGKGQQMNVSMATDNLSSYFNILPPGESDAAMYIGSTSGNEFDGTLPKSGDYKIRVYMMRNAARRDETANYRVEMIVTGAAENTASSTVPESSPEKPGGTPSKDEQACLQAVSIETNNGDVTLLSSETSEANNVVVIGVGPDRAPWRCLVSKGVVAEVSSMTDEGRL